MNRYTFQVLVMMLNVFGAVQTLAADTTAAAAQFADLVRKCNYSLSSTHFTGADGFNTYTFIFLPANDTDNICKSLIHAEQASDSNLTAALGACIKNTETGFWSGSPRVYYTGGSACHHKIMTFLTAALTAQAAQRAKDAITEEETLSS